MRTCCAAACGFDDGDVQVSAVALPEPAVAPASSARFRHIDALRAIAALLVVCLHVTQSYGGIGGTQPIEGGWMATWAQGLDVGRIGVVLFFLISGFVVPSGIRMDRPAPVATFLVRRAFRIYPAYWLSIPFCAFATWWLQGQPFGVADFLINLTLLQDLLGFHSASGVYWTLLVELEFYLLCVALAVAGQLRDSRRVAALACLFGIAHGLGAFGIWCGLPLNRTLVFLLLHLSLMLGGTVMRLRQDGDADVLARRLLVALIVYYVAVLPLGAVVLRGLFSNYFVATALGLLLFLAGIRLPQLGTRLLAWLGRISYSIYLFHVPVYLPLYWWISRQPADSAWRGLHMATYLAASMALTIAAAALVHRWVEQPGIRMGQRAADYWRRRRPPASVRVPVSALPVTPGGD